MYILIVLLVLAIVNGFVGYDCGSEGLNITTLSLLDIENYDIENIKLNEEEVYLQLLQTDTPV